MSDIVSAFIGADAAESAAETQANAAMEAARIQAEAAKFKPYNVTTGFGSAQFDTGAGTAGYTLDPRLAQMRDLLYGGATGIMPSAATQSFYGQVGQQAQQRALNALATDPTAAATAEYNTIQNLLAPQRAREQASLAQNLFKGGLMGAGTSYGAGSGYINPQQYAYMKALEEQNTQLGLTSLDRARQRQKSDIQDYFNLAGQAPAGLANQYGLGAGLFGKGLALEEYGLTPLELGINIGGKATTSARYGAEALGQGMTNAAGFQAAGAQAWPQALSTAFKSLGSRPSGSNTGMFGGPYGWGGQGDSYTGSSGGYGGGWFDPQFGYVGPGSGWTQG